MLHYSPQYIDDVLVRFAYHSNAIEGNSLTKGQTEAVILNDTITSIGYKGVKLRDVYEASNQKDAFYLMLNLAANNSALSVANVLKLHFELTKNTIGTAGKFKQNENRILGADFATASVSETPIAVKEWVDNTNYRLSHSKNNDEFLQSLMASHIKFERIHPFEDGNGRTGREIINFELAKRELPFLIIEKEDKPQYVTFEADQDYKGLARYAKNRLSQEKKRYQVFEKNYHSQQEFERKHKEKHPF